MRYLLGLLCILVPLLAEAQSATINLGWDYPAGIGQDGFVLARKLGQTGVYADLPLTIAASARTVADITAPSGQIVCYKLAATLTGTKGLYSTEVCAAALTAPLNLRIQ